jgi:hypothetical protein
MVVKSVLRAADVPNKACPPVSFGGPAMSDLCLCVKIGPKLAKTTLDLRISENASEQFFRVVDRLDIVQSNHCERIDRDSLHTISGHATF